MLGVLRQQNVALLWSAGLISLIGDWLLTVSLPFYVYEQTGSALATGAMFAAGLVPHLLFGSVAGVFVDRWDRKRTLVVTDLLRAALLALLLVVHSSERLWLIYVVVVLQASISVFSGPAQSALLPHLTSEAQLPEPLLAANALIAQRDAAVRLVGPPLGGTLFALLGLPALVLLDSGTFLLSAALTAAVRVPPVVQNRLAVPLAPPVATGPAVAAAPTAGTAGQPMRSLVQAWRDWTAGLAVVRREPLLRGLFAVEVVRMLADGIVGSLLVIFVKEVLAGDAQTLGWWATANAVGALCGGVLIGRFRALLQPPQFLGLGLVTVGVLALVRTNVPILGLVLLLNGLIGIAAIGARVSQQTLLQRAAADRYRGRIFGALGTVRALAMLIGAGGAALLGDLLGVIILFSLMSVLYVCSGMVALGLLGVAGGVRAEDAVSTAAAVGTKRAVAWAWWRPSVHR